MPYPARTRVAVGEKYGGWEVIEGGVGVGARVPCRCVCGTERPVLIQSLISATRPYPSCGCIRGVRGPNKNACKCERRYCEKCRRRAKYRAYRARREAKLAESDPAFKARLDLEREELERIDRKIAEEAAL
jgi:hypothetical protein